MKKKLVNPSPVKTRTTEAGNQRGAMLLATIANLRRPTCGKLWTSQHISSAIGVLARA